MDLLRRDVLCAARKSLTKMNLSAFYIDVVKGSIILLAALLDITRTRLLTQER